MNLIPDHPDESAAELERRVHGLLRSLPERSAPPSLENRVCAEIARRAARPWWRRSYSFWPAAARCAFIFTAIASAASIVWAFQALTEDAREMAQVIGGLIPPYLIVGALAALAVCYAVLARLGLAAYRTYSTQVR